MHLNIYLGLDNIKDIFMSMGFRYFKTMLFLIKGITWGFTTLNFII